MKEFFQKLFAHIEIKLILAQVFMLWSWAFDGETQILYAVGSLIFLDTVTGVYAVLVLEGFNGYKSRRFSEVLLKVIRYAVFMYVARVVDKSLPRHVFGPLIDIFVVTTEASSIFENFAKLGYTVPTSILNRLKSFFEKKGQ